jgi:hypothetical protein
MNTFNWVKGFGFGLVVWAIMLIVALALGFVGLGATLTTNLIVAFVAAVVAYAFTQLVHPETFGQAAGYGLLWAVIGFVLDFAIMHTFDTSVLASVQYWLLFAGIFLGSLVHGLAVELQYDSPRLHAH